MHHFIRIYLFLLLSTGLFTIPVLGQTGVIRGFVADSVSSETLLGVRVSIDSTKKGGVTNAVGGFLITGIPEGIYSVSFSFIGYDKKIVKDIRIHSGDTVDLGSVLLSTYSIKQVEIVDVRQTNTQAQIVDEIHKSDNVVSGIGGPAIGRGQSRTISDALKLIPGVTLMDSRFVMIRGLTPRYNAVLLNNVFAPSSEAEIRAFSFDILPVSMVDRILVYKTAAPELPGDFSGGVVKVFTRGIPDSSGIRINYSTSLRDNTTFRNFSETKQGSLFWLGYDNGYHALPQGFPDALTFKAILTGGTSSGPDIESRIDLGKLFDNENWYPVVDKAPLDHRLGIDFSVRKKIHGKHLFGSITSLSYSNTFARTPGQRQLRRIGDYDGTQQLFFNYLDENYEHTVRVSGLQNFALYIGNKHKLEFKNLYTHTGNSACFISEGVDVDNGFYYKTNTLRNTFRGIYSGQLSGKHEIIDSLHVNWTVGYANSVTDEPDFKNYQFTGTSPVTSDSLPIPSDVEYFNFLPVGSIISTTSPARYYGKTGETTRSAAIDFEYAPKVSTISWLKPKFRAGYYYEFKQRESFTRTLGYTITGQGTSFNLVSVDVDSVFLPENFNAGENGLLISEGSFIAPNYSAENRYNAGYVAASLPIGKKISIYGGIRVEHNIRKLGIKPLAESDFPFVEDTVFRLPSLNITYRLTKKHVLRFAYSETVNRPEFREASASSWYENIANPKIVISGNNTLKTASADNYDFRYEYYPQSGETFSFGAFYKQFTNPIEQVFTSASGVPSGTIVNTAGAYSYGMELELLQSCRNWFKKRNFFSDFAININAAYIRSQISVGDTLLVLDQYTDQRPLFGQAPYILNTSLYYQNDSLGLKVNLAYNITGPRIFRGGTSDGIPDIYEMPVHMFDLTITQRINKYMDCRFGIQNLLDAEFLFLQYYTEDRKIPAFKKEGDAVSYYNRFRTGRYYTLSLTFKF